MTDGSSVEVVDPALLDSWGDIQTGKNPMMLAASKDGSYVFVSIYGEGKVQVIDTKTDKVVNDINLGQGPHAMDISPDGGLLAAGILDEPKVYIIDAKEFKVIKAITTLGGVSEVKFSPDGKKLYVVQREKPMQVIDMANMEPVAEMNIPTETYDIAFSKSGDKLYVNSTDDGNMSIIDIKTSAVLKKIPAGKTGLAVSPDGNEIWFGGPGDKITVYSLTKNAVIATLPQDCDRNFTLLFSPDGKTVLATPAGKDNLKLYVYDAIKKTRKGVGRTQRQPPRIGIHYKIIGLYGLTVYRSFISRF